jgi:choline dehydrogenase-like flavoprotein
VIPRPSAPWPRAPSAAGEAPQGLGARRRATLEALLPSVLGLAGGEVRHAPEAAARVDDFLSALPQQEAADRVRSLLDLLAAMALLVHGTLPAGLDEEQRRDLFRRIFDSDRVWPDNVLEIARRLFGDDVPSLRDVARSLKELATLAWYGHPASFASCGFVPIWRRPVVRERRTRLDVDAIRRRHAEHSQRPAATLFANDGRPRIAVIGSGAAGSVVAARLAGHFDVAVFESGARFRPREYPLDPLAAMALLYEQGLLFPTRDLDLRVLQARVVGGGSAVNEGVSVRPRPRTMSAWARDGMGIDLRALDEALDAVERRQRFSPFSEDLLTEQTLRFRAGGERVAGLRVELLRADLATHPEMHAGQPHADPDRRGARCLACGHCNFGCHFGHHLGVDRTFLRDAESCGARIHPNLSVHHLVAGAEPRAASEGRGDARITGLRLSRDPHGPAIPVDHVVLAAGAIGSPALMLRSTRRQPLLAALPAARAERIGAGLGFNYGTPVVARFGEAMAPPGWRGLQIGFVATKPEDESFIIESGFIPPGVMASIVPGVGADHRRWMAEYPRLGMCVNTIGSPSDGRVDRRGAVRFKVGASQMGLIHETLATMVSIYLHAGAVEVGVSGCRGIDDAALRFDPSFRGREGEIRARIAQHAPSAEQLALASGHPQGGMRMDSDRDRGVVDPRFRVHGTKNLWVADASLFPSTITVNPQWLVMALGWMAGDAVAEGVRRDLALVAD